MPLVHAVRVARGLGWFAILASSGVVVATTAYQAAVGPAADQSFWPSPRLWRCYGNTLWMSACAVVLALVLALPAVFALVHARRPWLRGLVRAATVFPLLTMPSIFAYAWLLLATSPNRWIAACTAILGGNHPGLEPVQAAIALAAWLWPIPALVLTTSFRNQGLQAYQLARLDAAPARAFISAVLPAMWPTFAAAAGIVFILASLDATVPPLLSAGETWAVEIMANAAVAFGSDRPVANLFWQCWPMLATISLVLVAAVPGLRQMTRWSDDWDPVGGTDNLAASRWTYVAGCLAAALAVFPICAFWHEMTMARDPTRQTFVNLWKTSGDAILASLLVAVVTALIAAAAALATIGEPSASGRLRLIAIVATIAAAIAALLPPELSATALVAVYGDPAISPPGKWNLYDNTPAVWIAAMLSRFSFLPICVAHLVNRQIPGDLPALASVDGADHLQRIVFARLPILWRPLLAASLVVACLTISETTASLLVQPTRFFGGSLAVHVDSQMHYGRQDETIALGLLMLAPALLAAIAVPLLARGPVLARWTERARILAQKTEAGV